jgi:hypothetical protein
MPYALYSSATMTLIFFLLDHFYHQRKSYLRYALVFIVTFIFTYFVTGEAREFKSQYPWECYSEVNSYEDYQYYEDKIWGHLAQMEECMVEAREISVLMPCTNDREKANILFKVVMAGFVPTLPQQKILAMAMVFLGEYIPACSDEWQRLVSLIEEAKYHSEMAVFYNNVFRYKFNESQF